MKNWTTFKKRIVINKAPSAVYECWATKGKMETWFLETADYHSGDKLRASDESIQRGDHFTWKWNNWDFTEKGQILEANGKDLVAFTFGAGGVVRVSLNDTGNGTEVVLTQEEIPSDENSKMELFVGCSTGWTFWLTNLKAYLEHGITLHAKGLQQDETTDLVNS